MLTASTTGWREPLTSRDRFTFVLPPGWSRIRLLTAEARRADVERLAAALSHGRPDRHLLVPQLVRHLDAAVTQRHDPSAVEAHLSTTRGGGPPIACSLVVSLLATCADPDAALGPGAEVLPHDGGRVVRQERPGPSLLVQHLFPDADGGAVLLSWSSPQLALAEPLRAVFDAVAGSLRRLS